MNDNTEADEVTRVAVAPLRAWEADIDAVQRARLTAARRRALSPPPQRVWPVWAGGALAASLALAIGMSAWTTAPAPLQPLDSTLIDSEAMLEGSGLSDADALVLPDELDGDLDLYLWLDGADAA